MKAIWYTRQGAAHDVLQYGEQPEPHAAAGEVRIKLYASGVNPADIYRRAGPNFQMDGPLIIPNSDGAGVVDEAGRGVDRGLIGRRVWLYNGQRNGRVFGTAAEYITISDDLVRELPRNTSFTEGACLGTSLLFMMSYVLPESRMNLVTTAAGTGSSPSSLDSVSWSRAEN
jgi:NADPH2:quinone reductase